MAGHFVPVCSFGQVCQSYPTITCFIKLFYLANLGVDTSYTCGDICNIDKKMIQNITIGNRGTFHPGLFFLDNFAKGTPLWIFSLDVHPCFCTKKPDYKWSATRFYFKPFMENSPQIYIGILLQFSA